jgi:hypothetical protein
MTPAERHARNLASLAELEAEDAAATPGPWRYEFAYADQEDTDKRFVVSMRNRNPAVLALIRGVLERHAPLQVGTKFYCGSCSTRLHAGPWPCADYLAAENALGVGHE